MPVGQFSGILPHTEQGIFGFADVIAEEFNLISLRGVIDQAGPLLVPTEGPQGIWSGIRFSIRIQNCRLRFADGMHCPGTYEEWHERDRCGCRRFSSGCAQTGAVRLRPSLGTVTCPGR